MPPMEATATLNGATRVLVARLRAELERQPDVLEAYLFGSTARGEAGALSDIDVGVQFDAEVTGTSPAVRAAELAADLGSALGTNAVEVVALNGAPPLLHHRILRDGVRLVARDVEAATRRAGEALSRYCDYQPQLEKIEAAHRRRIAAGEFGR